MARWSQLSQSVAESQGIFLGFLRELMGSQLWAFSTALLGHKHEADLEVEKPELKQVPIWNIGSTGRRLAYHTMALAPLQTCHFQT